MMSSKIRTSVSNVYSTFVFRNLVAGSVKPSGFFVHGEVTSEILHSAYRVHCVYCMVLVRAKLTCVYNPETVFTARYELNL
jgi:hypothetical protein